MDYQFSMKALSDGFAEVRIVMPSPKVIECDLQGLDARKRLVKWIASSAAGLGESCGLNLHAMFHDIYMAFSQAVDHEHWQQAIIREVRKGGKSFRDLEEHPPEGLTADHARGITQELVNNGLLFLDDERKLSVKEN